MNPTPPSTASLLFRPWQVGAAVLLLWLGGLFTAWTPAAGTHRRVEFNASAHAPVSHLLADAGTANFSAEDDDASSPIPPLLAALPLLLSLLLATRPEQPLRFRRLSRAPSLRLHLLVRVMLI